MLQEWTVVVSVNDSNVGVTLETLCTLGKIACMVD